jgi:hypothetical protein
MRYLADRGASGVSAEGLPLERQQPPGEPPRTIGATPLEGTTLRARRITGDAAAGFTAFLDGTQQSRAVGYVLGVPIVLGTVAAVVRERRNRRMCTWDHRVESHLYAPLGRLDERLVSALRADYGDRLVDTTAPHPLREPPGAHPFSLQERAVHLVQEDRERLETALASRWCGLDAGMLFIDGGISGNESIAQASCVVGVIKSHRTLYAEGEALAMVLALPHGWRSSVFRITSARRSAVASWYLRLRDPAGRDPLWGLVRIEVAAPDRAADPGAVSRRADEVSRWILAEAAPLSLPDARWDKMVYGVRDCEEFLRAVM